MAESLTELLEVVESLEHADLSKPARKARDELLASCREACEAFADAPEPAVDFVVKLLGERLSAIMDDVSQQSSNQLRRVERAHQRSDRSPVPSKTELVRAHLEQYPEDLDEDPHAVVANIHSQQEQALGAAFDPGAMPGYELVRREMRKRRG